jgi:uncharacterized protein YmfQ (DUF2313 family)
MLFQNQKKIGRVVLPLLSDAAALRVGRRSRDDALELRIGTLAADSRGYQKDSTRLIDVTADELVFDKAKHQPRACHKELFRDWEKVENLPEDDKQTIKKLFPLCSSNIPLNPSLDENYFFRMVAE